MASWVPVDENSDFSLQNLPYGVFSTDGLDPRCCVAIGDYVLDLHFLAQDHVFDDLEFNTSTLQASTLNEYAALGSEVHRRVRKRLKQLLAKDTDVGSVLRDNQDRKAKSLFPMESVEMHLPMKIGDYTDFFVGLPHAETCIEIVRPGKSLQDAVPSFFGLPMAYHGRASSVVVSGTPFHRPKGQYPVDGKPRSGHCQKLDFEVEFACFIAKGSKMGSSIHVDEAEDHIFGVVLMNDWSARDIQFWEASLMGPFGGKNFCTTVSPWIVPLEALEEFRVAPQLSHRQLLPYLTEAREKSVYDIPIEVNLETGGDRYHVSKCNTSNVIFSLAQMVAHHTRGGCPLRTGDLIATGTLSGVPREEQGCMLEMTQDGRCPREFRAKSSAQKTLTRNYLEDGDIIEFTAQLKCENGLGNVGFGICKGQVLASVD